MCFLFTWFYVPAETPWPFRRGAAGTGGRRGYWKARGVYPPTLAFRPKALHFRFESYASTVLPDEVLSGFALAASAARARGRRTKHGIGHTRSGNRPGACAQSLAEGHAHSHSSEPGAGDH